MAAYSVILSPRAARDLEALSSEVALRITRRLQTLENDPSPRDDGVDNQDDASP